MKKSVILLELIISILIISIVGIYSLKFISNLYKSNSQNLNLLNLKLDFQSTNLFIENRLKNSVLITNSSNRISFYEVDINSLKSNYYSGFTILENSSKEFVTTVNSLMALVDAKYIWFHNNNIYEIQQSFENNKIYVKNANSEKKIYEQYKLVKRKSEIYLMNHKLYFNENILQDNIKSFQIKQINSFLVIDICSSLCKKWVTSL